MKIITISREFGSGGRELGKRLADALGIQEGYAWLDKQGVCCTLEWNPGNHFKDPELRTAKAFVWVMLNSCLLT